MTEAEIEYLEGLAARKRMFVEHCNNLKVKVKSMSDEELNKKFKEIELAYERRIANSNVPKRIKAERDYELNIYRRELRRRNLNG